MKGFKDFYQHLLDHLTNNVPQIKHIDLWNGQTMVEDKELPFNMHAVFIDLSSITAKRLGNKRYETDVLFQLHVVSEQFMDTDSNTSSSNREEGLTHLELMDNILFWMDGHMDETIPFNAIGWEGTQIDINRSDIAEHVMSFRTRLVINTAKRTFVKINPPSPTLEIQPEIPE